MQKRRIALLACCICLACGKLAAYAATEQPQDGGSTNTELIVLVDTSASIQGEKREKEIQWAQEICALCDDLDIGAAYVYFDDPEENYGIECSTYSSTKECLDVLEHMSHNGQLTELAGPMGYAVSVMDQKQAKNKYIIVLSDGDEDLVKRNGRTLEEVPYSKEEEANIEAFRELAINFDKEENQEVILVGLGADVSLFSTLNIDHSIRYFSGEEGTKESLTHTFGGLGYPIEEIQGERVGNGRVDVRLRDGLYRAMLNLRWDGNVEHAEDMLRVIHDLNEIEVSESFLLGDSSMFVYISEPEGGVYQIELPVENLRCTGFQQDKMAFGGMKLSIPKDMDVIESITMKDIGQTKYVVKKGNIKFLVEPKVEKGDLKKWYPQIVYYTCPYISGEEIKGYLQDKSGWSEGISVNRGLEKTDKGVKFCIPSDSPGEYLYTVEVITNKQSEFSNTILIKIAEDIENPTTSSVDQDIESRKAGDKINLKAYLSETENGKAYFTLKKKGEDDGQRFELDGIIEKDAFIVREKWLEFLEEGTYIMEVNEEGMMKRIVEFSVTYEKTLWERICDWICFWKK